MVCSSPRSSSARRAPSTAPMRGGGTSLAVFPPKLSGGAQMRLLHRQRPLTRDIAAVASGLAVGVVGSRLLPPLVASAAGSVRATLGENPFERLTEDHRSVLALL